MKNKIKVMKATPDVTDDELRSYMNFDELLNQSNRLLARRRKIRIGVAGLSLSVLLLVTGYWYLGPKRQADTMKPVGSATEQDTTTLSKETEQVSSQDSIQEIPKTTAIRPAPPVEESVQSTPEVRESQPAIEERPSANVYVEAEPVAGYSTLYEYFNRELSYPTEALNDSIEGVMTVFFVINENGMPESIRFANSLGPLFDAEATRLIGNMPPWKPATLNGKPVSSRLSIPLTFNVESANNQK